MPRRQIGHTGCPTPYSRALDRHEYEEFGAQLCYNRFLQHEM